MKTDLYTKTILTIIACCLTFNVLKDMRIIPEAYPNVSGAFQDTGLPANGLRANEDGSSNVRLATSVIEVKPASGAEFKVKPVYNTDFQAKAKSSTSSPVYVKQTGSSVTSLSSPTPRD